jgi:hypothetical protein
MSTNQYMHGSYIIPSKEWASFKKKIVKAWNTKRDAYKAMGDIFYSEFKGRKINSLVDTENTQISLLAKPFTSRYGLISYYSAYDLLCANYNGSPLKAKLIKPTQSSLDKVMKKSGNTTTSFSENESEYSISFDNNNRTVSISVDENNRNVDCFFRMDDVFRDSFFRALDQVKWSRGSGGEIKVVSESHSDDPHDEKYDTDYIHGYGPIHDKEKEHRHEVMALKIKQCRTRK